MNYYEILQVEKSATQEEIKKSYRRLAKEYHPDKNSGNDAKFKQLAEAYEHLGDSNKRAAYDNKLHFSSNSPFEDFMRNFAGDFSNMFNNAWDSNARGSDIRLSISISIEDVYYGVRKYVDIGNGGFNLEIPKGIKNGSKLKVSGKGQPHPVNSSAPNGDLLITINVIPSDTLIVSGDDIWTDYYLPFYDLILGTEIHIKTTVNSIKLKVPENSFDGKVLRVAGKGMPIMNTGNYGNMMVKLRATYNTLNETQLKLIKKIKLAENV